MKSRLYKKVALLVAIFTVAVASAQIPVTGTVSDETGTPLPGVNITVDGSSKGTTTDFDGNFEIEVEEGDQLIFSSVGFEDQTHTVENDESIEITLKEGSELDEVIVVGYGTQKKSDLTGSVSTVSSSDISQRPVTNMVQALAGKASGVDISNNSGRPGGETRVRIRGNNSINASNDPLYVVDGVIGAGPINYLNPNDIESIEVLKDASSTAIYGARGANGVVIVTTKKGSDSEASVSYSGYTSIGVLNRKLGLLNSSGFLETELNSYKNAEKYDPSGWKAGDYEDPMNYRSNDNLFNENGDPLYDTDWQKEATRTAVSQNHNLSITGGDKDNSYGLFLNYADEEGIIQESDLTRYSARVVVDNQVKDWLKISGGLTFNQVDENRVDGGVGGLTPLRMIVETLPIIPVKYPDGEYGSNGDYPNMEGGENPVNLLRNRKDLYRTQTVLGNLNASIDITEDLVLQSTLGTNIVNEKNDFYSGRSLKQLSADAEGEASISNQRNNYWQFENYLTYNKDIAEDQSLEAMVGVGWQEYKSFYSYSGAKGFSDDFYQYNNLGVGKKPLTPESSVSSWTMNSYFGRVNYNLKEKYLFTVTGRLDGSSKFGEDHKRAFFPSGAFAWNVSKEDFLKNNATINNLKLRTSYGATGNSEIGEYESLASMGTSTAILGGNRAPGVGISTLANPDLKWERTEQVDFGFELGLFNSAIKLEADIYYKKTKDMLLDAPVPTSSGYASIYKNIGSLSNKGIDLSVQTRNISTEDVQWNTILNLSANKNEILHLGDADDDIFPGPSFLAETNVLRVGESVGSFYGLNRTGIWGSDEADEAARYNALPGDVKHEDINDDGEVNAGDRDIIGNAYPKLTGSFLNTFTYKNFDFTLDIQFSYGNDVLNLSRHSGEDRTGQANSYNTVLNGWTPDNQDTDIAQNRPANAGYTTTVDSHMVEDGSFIRGRNLILGYNFSDNVLDKLSLTQLRVYASLQNFFLITNYSGYDPEVSTYGDAFAQGITFFDYPKPTTITLGLNVNF